jgi:tetratricopeptide (TPR) repeat protein
MNVIKRISIFLILLISSNGSFFAQKEITEEARLIRFVHKEKNPEKKLLRLISLGEYYQTTNIHKADSLRQIIIDNSADLSEIYRFKAILYAAEMQHINGNQELYFSRVLEMESYLNIGLSNFQKYKIHYHLGNYYTHNLDFKKAKEHLQIALVLAKKARNNTSISRTYSAIAQNFMFSNSKDSAFYYTNISIQYARRSANKSVMAESFNTQSILYAYFDQIELSVAKNYFSLQLAASVNDYGKLANYTREIGQSELLISNFNEAEKYFKQSIDYAKRVYDNRQIALGYTNLSTVFKEKGDYETAIQYNMKAIDLLTKLNDFNGLGEAHNNLGLIYNELKNYDLAVQNYNKALVYYESTINKERIAAVYHNVGTVFSQQKKYENALNYLNRSIEIRKNYGSKNQIYHTYRIIADVYKATGQKEKSLDYLSKYINYLDSNTSLQKSSKIAELSELYRSEERERLIARQQDSIARQKQQQSWKIRC